MNVSELQQAADDILADADIDCPLYRTLILYFRHGLGLQPEKARDWARRFMREWWLTNRNSQQDSTP